MSNLEMFFSALGGGATAAAVLGCFLNYAGKAYIDKLKIDAIEDRKAKIAEQSSIRATVKKYSRVILLSAGDLQDRLWHFCNRIVKPDNKILLAKDELSPKCGSWPMTKRHYLTSTMYLFARYFYWVEILKSRICLLEFDDDEKTSEFNYHLKRVERMLAETDLHKFVTQQKTLIDKPIFQLMQSEIGECIRDGSGEQDQCMSYHQFRIDYDNLIKTSEGLQQLEDLLISSMSDDQSNFCLTRLKLVSNALIDMVIFLCEINTLSPPEKLIKVDTGAFHDDKYLAEWPSVYKPSSNSSFLPTAFGGH